MTQSLRGHSALVTGGTRGIGKATAERLLLEGASVTVTGTSSQGDPPEGAQYLGVDFADPTKTAAFATLIANAGFDILVNNAGTNRIAPFAEIDPADFERIQRVNVTAPFLLCRSVIPGMRKKGWGRIVTVSSIWGRISREQRGSYSASKFAVDGMTAALAAEVARDGILANCVAPGFTETEMTREIIGEAGMKDLAKQVPIGRLAKPEEIAALVVWLVGPENTYISGQNIVIDGGFTRV